MSCCAIGGSVEKFAPSIGKGVIIKDIEDSFKRAAAEETASYSLSLKQDLLDNVLDVLTSHSESNWDAYGAAPISSEAVSGAVQFINDYLPDGISMPEVTPEADGSISLDWRESGDCLLSIDFVGDKFYFAGHFGEEQRIRGAGVISKMPAWNHEQIMVQQLLQILREYFPAK